jgi:hypothetical protein
MHLPFHVAIPFVLYVQFNSIQFNSLPFAKKKTLLYLLINAKLAPLGRMEQGLLIINGIRSEKPIAGIAQTGKDLAVLIELVVDRTNANANVGLFFNQFLQTIAAGNDAQDVNLGNAPLRPNKADCNNLC